MSTPDGGPPWTALPSLHRSVAVLRLLRTPWLGPGILFSITFVAYVLIPAAWAFRDGNLVAHDGIDAFLTARNSYVFAIPLVFAAITSYYRETSDVVARLIATRVVDGTPAAYAAAVDAVQSAWWSRGLSVLFGLTGVVLPVTFLWNLEHAASVTWLFSTPDTPRPVALYFVPLFHGLGIFVFTTWVLHHLRASAILHRILRRESDFVVRLTILHPDDCMGLGPVGDMLKSVAAVLASLGLVFFTWQAGTFYSNVVGPDPSPVALVLEYLGKMQSGGAPTRGFRELTMLTAWVAFTFFSPLVFFAPLSSAKEAMQSVKKDALLKLGARLVSVDGVIRDPALVRVFRRVQKARVWPFNVRTVASFVVTIVGPLALTIVTEIVKSAFLTPSK